MKKGLVIFGIVVLVLAAALGGAYWWISRPVELQAYDDGLPPHEAMQRSSEVETALAAVGIGSALVDIDAERAYVAYDMPAESEWSSEDLQTYTLGILAGFAPETPKAYIVQFVDQEPTLAWEADLDGARAVAAGTMDESAYLATIVKPAL